MGLCADTGPVTAADNSIENGHMLVKFIQLNWSVRMQYLCTVHVKEQLMEEWAKIKYKYLYFSWLRYGLR